MIDHSLISIYPIWLAIFPAPSIYSIYLLETCSTGNQGPEDAARFKLCHLLIMCLLHSTNKRFYNLQFSVNLVDARQKVRTHQTLSIVRHTKKQDSLIVKCLVCKYCCEWLKCMHLIVTSTSLPTRPSLTVSCSSEVKTQALIEKSARIALRPELFGCRTSISQLQDGK